MQENNIHYCTQFLAPPGAGLLFPESELNKIHDLNMRQFGTSDPKSLENLWLRQLNSLSNKSTLLVGIPSDLGAGVRRGAALGPTGIRAAYLARNGSFPPHVLDLGDVRVIPWLLHDEMLSDQQILSARKLLYPQSKEELPVSPLSIVQRLFTVLRQMKPDAKVLALGGDHSISWPAVSGISPRKPWGIIHIDAHDDLVPDRFGVRYCYTTWAHHVLSESGVSGMIQVGVHTSSPYGEQWKRKRLLEQIPVEDERNCDDALDQVFRFFRDRQISQVYVSVDIDAIDSKEAPATGTPEAFGLSGQWVKEFLEKIQARLRVVGGDIVEVAPLLAGDIDFSCERTCITAAKILETLL